MLQTVLVVYEGLVTRHLGSMYSGIDKVSTAVGDLPSFGGREAKQGEILTGAVSQPKSGGLQ